MITFVYCCIINLLIVFCQSAIVESEGYSNDSPDILPKEKFLRYRVGSDIILRCNGHHINNDQIQWEFKHCANNLEDTECNDDSGYHLTDDNTDWVKLDYGKGKRKLEIKDSEENDSGVYRCIADKLVLEVFIVKIVVALAKYTGPPPKILSLISTNYTVQLNSHVTIMCNTTSLRKPEIRWFKECVGKCDITACDITAEGHCYYALPFQNSFRDAGNRIYLSKLTIYNARNIDSGNYVCLVFSLYGKDYKNVVIRVQGDDIDGEKYDGKLFSLLFLMPLAFILVPITVWLCYFKRKKKCEKISGGSNSSSSGSEQQKRLIKPVMKLNIVLERNTIV